MDANAWTLQRLPELNRAILARTASPQALVYALRTEAFPLLGVPESYHPVEAEQITTLLGMWGSACVRHHVEHGLVPATDTRAIFDQLRIRSEPFREYLGRVAARTGTGHPDRDTYTSYFHWNPPAVHVEFAGQRWTSRGVVHRLFAEFTRTAVTPEFFSDIWLQYTNHWEPGDFPPSDAADVEFIARDFLPAGHPGDEQQMRQHGPAGVPFG